MQVDKAHILKLAHLAKLELSDDETNRLQHDLTRILTWVEKLNEINTDGIEPLVSPVEAVQAWREDMPGQHLQREKALGNAPLADDQFILVPKIIS
jgi:aspartyl-tRNA(Asn)/glutamyl-tRNA(Gln) amidotransferase subunit C